MEATMETAPTLITLARHFGASHTQYRVLATSPDRPASSAGDELATLELNHRICLPDGQVHRIARRGGPFSPNWELWYGPSATPGEPPVATCLRERVGILRWRNVLVVGTVPKRRYLLRRRGWLGSPANVDVIALAAGMPQSGASVLLHAEKSGTWRRRLQAQWLAPGELPLPVVLLVLNVLADWDQRAAAAASAGAAGV
jgi:hypothetical protein